MSVKHHRIGISLKIKRSEDLFNTHIKTVELYCFFIKVCRSFVSITKKKYNIFTQINENT